MTTLASVELRCPCCGKRFEAEALASFNILGQHTDFRPEVGGIPFIFHTVQTCPGCGFTWGSDDFEEYRVSPDLRKKIENVLTPLLGEGPLTPARKHELLARLYEAMGSSSLHIAGAYLHAAWCSSYMAEDEPGETEGGNHSADEMEYRKKALCHLESALKTEGLVPREERARLTYLAGELCRRVGDEKKARTYFDMVPGEIVDKRGQRWILNLAEQQRDAPRDRITGDIYENKELNALFGTAREFLVNSVKLRERVIAPSHMNYKAMINGRRRVMLTLFKKDTCLRIALEKHWVMDKEFWTGLLASLLAFECEGITVRDRRKVCTIWVDAETSPSTMETLLVLIKTGLLDNLGDFSG